CLFALATEGWEGRAPSLYAPPALQFRAEAHDPEGTDALPPRFRAPVPGSSAALPQMPFTSLATNACLWPEPSVYDPPALQFRAEAHDTGAPDAFPPGFGAPVRGASAAFPKMLSPCVAPTACWWPEPSVYDPPALQLPARAHDSEATDAFPPRLSVPVPGSLMALPQ